MQQAIIIAITLGAIALWTGYVLLRKRASHSTAVHEGPKNINVDVIAPTASSERRNDPIRHSGSSAPAALKAASFNRDKLTVLIVDDQSMIRLLLKEVFETADVQVLDAENGYEALALLDKYRVDFVLTDMKMPGMDGIELLRRVRELSGNTNAAVKCAFISAYSDPGKKEEADRLGALSFFAKPFDIYTVRQFVLEHIKAEESISAKIASR